MFKYASTVKGHDSALIGRSSSATSSQRLYIRYVCILASESISRRKQSQRDEDRVFEVSCELLFHRYLELAIRLCLHRYRQALRVDGWHSRYQRWRSLLFCTPSWGRSVLLPAPMSADLSKEVERLRRENDKLTELVRARWRSLLVTESQTVSRKPYTPYRTRSECTGVSSGPCQGPCSWSEAAHVWLPKQVQRAPWVLACWTPE